MICKASADETPSVNSLFHIAGIELSCGFRLVENVEAEEQPVLDQLGVGFDLGFQAII